MATPKFKTLYDPVFNNNPIMLQVLGICSALAVTTSMKTTVTMCIAVVVVLMGANIVVSAIRRFIPGSIRMIVQMVVIASLVIVVDQFLKAFAYQISKELTVFVSLIITNCIVMGRTEAFAIKNNVIDSALDGLGNGLGYSVVLLVVGTVRELFGMGTLFGVKILLPVTEAGGWYYPNGLLVQPAGAFFVVGFLIWVVRIFRPELQESE